MKVELKIDGTLVVKPENELEAYALEKWGEGKQVLLVHKTLEEDK